MRRRRQFQISHAIRRPLRPLFELKTCALIAPIGGSSGLARRIRQGWAAWGNEIDELPGDVASGDDEVFQGVSASKGHRHASW